MNRRVVLGALLGVVAASAAFGLAVAVSSVLSGSAVAGEYNKKINIGDSIPKFADLPATDDKKYSLSDFEKKDVLVVVVTTNHCPVAVAYEDRIVEFAKKHTAGDESKVALLAVNVNRQEADRLPKMKERAKEKGFNFPYAFDESQALGRELGAAVTPEFFVFDKDRKLVYMGAMDDSQDEPKVNYLEQAVAAALSGEKPATAETRARGCGIGYERQQQ